MSSVASTGDEDEDEQRKHQVESSRAESSLAGSQTNGATTAAAAPRQTDASWIMPPPPPSTLPSFATTASARLPVQQQPPFNHRQQQQQQQPPAPPAELNSSSFGGGGFECFSYFGLPMSTPAKNASTTVTANTSSATTAVASQAATSSSSLSLLSEAAARRNAAQPQWNEASATSVQQLPSSSHQVISTDAATYSTTTTTTNTIARTSSTIDPAAAANASTETNRAPPPEQQPPRVKRKPGRPRKHGKRTTKTGTGPKKARGSVGKRRRTFSTTKSSSSSSRQLLLLKRSSSGALAASRGGGRAGASNTRNSSTVVILDDDAKRLVNPLLEMPYVASGGGGSTVKQRHNSSPVLLSTAATGATTSTLFSGGTKASTSSCSSSSSGNNAPPPQASDVVWQYTSLSHSLPDTYSLAHQARLLGFDVPPAPPTARQFRQPDCAQQQQHGTPTATTTTANSISAIPLQVDTLRVVNKNGTNNNDDDESASTDAIYQIPSLGTWHLQTKQMPLQQQHEQQQQQQQQDYVDPFYKTLLQQAAGGRDGTSSESSLPNSSALVATTAIAPLTKKQQEHVWNEIMMVGRRRQGRLPPLMALLKRLLRQNGDDDDKTTLDERTVVSTTVHPEKGLFCVTLGKVQVKYDFSWFPIENEENVTNSALDGGGSSRRQVSELVLHVHDVTVREDDKREDKDSATANENDCSNDNADDDYQVELFVVVCLIVHHARLSHVWYGLWHHVPKDLVDFFQLYFDMVVLPDCAQNKLSEDGNDGQATSGVVQDSQDRAALGDHATNASGKVDTATADRDDSTDKQTLAPALPPDRSTTSLLCDLHRCTTRHASLVFQQEQAEDKRKRKHGKMRKRMLVRLPTVDQASSLLSSSSAPSGKNGGQPTNASPPLHSRLPPPQRAANNRRSSLSTIISSAKEGVRNVAFGIRVNPAKETNVTEQAASALQVLNDSGQVVVMELRGPPVKADAAAMRDAAVTVTGESADNIFPTFPVTSGPPETTAMTEPASNDLAAPIGVTAASSFVDSTGTATAPSVLQASIGTVSASPTAMSVPPSWEVLKVFDQVVPNSIVLEDDDIAQELKVKQAELAALEGGMEAKARSLLQQVVDVRMVYEKNAEKRQEERDMLKAYEKILERRKEIDVAWQKQLEQDMDAVCDICKDGEVTPDNQILFCEACNVAVHQMCYGIEKVPEGDYYCIACRYLGRDKMSQALLHRGGVVKRVAPSPLPICCELCPRKQGAFVRSDTSSLRTTNPDGTSSNVLSKWVHVVCAKWQGLNFAPPGQTDVVEDVQELKRNFLRHGYSCILCLGRRGAYVKCRHKGCESWMHVTCARASGLCEVTHGENCHGDVKENPWTLLCPSHSTIDPESIQDRVTIEQLVRSAEQFPPEPLVEPLKMRPSKVFNKMNEKERRRFLADTDYEQEFLAELNKKLHGVHCEVCQQFEEDGRNLKKCVGCSVVFCMSCVLPTDLDPDGKEYKCPACAYVSDMEKNGDQYEQPQCTMCFQPGGWLRPAHAQPVNRKTYWRQNPDEFEKTLFAKKLWCHSLCTMWHPKVSENRNGEVDCSNIVMTNGREHILGSIRCSLCGSNRKMKVACSEEGCRCWGQKRGPFNFHVTCAREAGLEVKDKLDENNRYYFDTKCFRHSGSDFVFRARLEDLIEIERRRAGKNFEKSGNPMSLAHASRLYNKSIVAMRMLGWAWRWAEWWVEFGDNWEPLLEPGEREEDMTKEELKIVDSTRESRCHAARKCRLAALGASLRNRNFDKEEGDDKAALDRALRAVLHTPELVGPLEQYEIDFFAEWLARVYRSKSRLLGYGEEKIPIQDYSRTLHVDDKSPKYVLGDRRLPGKQELSDGNVFETDFHEADDFLKPEMFEDGTLVTAELLRHTRRDRRRRDDTSDSEQPSRKTSRRGTRSRLVAPSEGVETTEKSSPILEGTAVTLSAVYSTENAAADGFASERKAAAKLQLLPSAIEAVVVAPLAAVIPRKRKSSDPATASPTKRRARSPKSTNVSSSECQTDEDTTSVTKRRGRPPSKKRIGRPPKSKTTHANTQSDGNVAQSIKRPGPGQKSRSCSSVDQRPNSVINPTLRKRFGRPPKSAALTNVADATPTPNERDPGRPVRASKTPADSGATASPSETAVDSTATNCQVLIDTAAGVCIAERIKARHAASEARDTQYSEMAIELVAGGQNANVAVNTAGSDTSQGEDADNATEKPTHRETGSHDNADESDEVGGPIEPSMEAAYVVCGGNEDGTDDISIATFVARQRQAQEVATSMVGGPERESSVSSSGSDVELPLSEMSAIQRGRCRGKLNAIREMR